MKSNPIPYLSDYLSNPSIESLASIGGEVAQLPQSWIQFLALENNERITRVLAEWKKFGDCFYETIPKLEKNLVSVELLKNEGEYSLLYEIKGPKQPLYYEAKNSLKKQVNNNIESLWPGLPHSIRDFYEFHNGFFYLASHSLGPSPLEEVFLLSDEEWGILESIPAPPVDLDKTIALFTNGMSGYVCLDMSKPDPENEAIIWWSNKAPKLDVKFWDIVDAWTAIGMDG